MLRNVTVIQEIFTVSRNTPKKNGNSFLKNKIKFESRMKQEGFIAYISLRIFALAFGWTIKFKDAMWKLELVSYLIPKLTAHQPPFWTTSKPKSI